MINAIFCVHDRLTCTMLELVQMIYGGASAGVVAFVPGENVSDIVEKLRELVSIHTNGEWLVAVDLQCGSPWDAAAALAMHNPVVRVISGSSLPLTLELVDDQSDMNVNELYGRLTTIVQQACVVWKYLETAEEDL